MIAKYLILAGQCPGCGCVKRSYPLILTIERERFRKAAHRILVVKSDMGDPKTFIQVKK